MRKRRILDTSHLIRHWQKRRAAALTKPVQHAHALIALYQTNAIVTPVALEFLAGFTQRDEMQAAQTFLRAFRCVDEQNILKDDWREASRRIRRIPRTGKRRQLADCLIAAIARRLGYVVETLDKGFPH